MELFKGCLVFLLSTWYNPFNWKYIRRGLENMRLYDIETEKLLRILEKAHGNVYLKTEDGNTLNLKSGLCRHYGIQGLLEGAKECDSQAELSVETPEDELLFIDHMTRK